MSQRYIEKPSPMMFMADNVADANHVQNALSFFLPDELKKNILILPDRETLPYDQLTTSSNIVSTRLEALLNINSTENPIVIVNIQSAMNYLIPKEILLGNSLVLKENQTLDTALFKNNLEIAGYYHTNTVIEHGEYAHKGGIIDIYPMGSQYPFRIEFDDDMIESIRSFDPESQLTKKAINKINCLPANEYILNGLYINNFKEKYKEYFTTNPKSCSLYKSVIKKIPFPGLEYYLPLFSHTCGSIFDYIPVNTLIFHKHSLYESANDYYKKINERFNMLSVIPQQPILKPSIAFQTPERIFSILKKYECTKIANLNKTSSKHHITFSSVPKFNIDIHNKNPMQAVVNFINKQLDKVLIIADSLGRQEVLSSLLKEVQIIPEPVKSWQHFYNSDTKIAISHGKLDSGININGVTIITEYELFGYTPKEKSKLSTNNIDPTLILSNLVELDIGQHVVHAEYGIAIYQGLKTLSTGNHQNDFMCLEYANNDVIYVPITSLSQISRYGGLNTDNVNLSRLGSQKWKKDKDAAITQIKDIAADLLEIYTKRTASKGISFKIEQENFKAFCARFEFDDTEDQEKATNEIKDDMEKNIPMDRLLCGDVGYGKTEIANRAIYIAISNKKQVAVIVPTTLLANQHYSTMINRFAGYDITIESLSRFKSNAEKKKIIEMLANGKINIIIATHSLLQKNIIFQNLGLLIIDEEHRFGVKQKEFIKNKKSNVDILSMTATPIPRTLNMSLNGLRDISIIATPPNSRLAVKTYIQQSSPIIIREAILRELLRGGQIFYLHNNIQSLQQQYQKLKEIVPEADITIAHGQLPEKQLEHIMSDFYHGKFHILLCTTIIETGIDIPSVNTIIIDRADKFGLAQLYQLRGRVGRSHHQAYAYLFIPEQKQMTNDAKKRIEAISNLKTLGAGFTLASYDLDIRGAGEILGENQSGNVDKIGFSLYHELLNHTIKDLKNNRMPDLLSESDSKCEVNLQNSAILPEKYIYSVKDRLLFYKKISSATTKEQLNNIQVELIDRFGLLPEEAKNLFKISEMILTATSVGINSIQSSKQNLTLSFIANPNIRQEKILELITQHPKQYKITNANKLHIAHQKTSIDSKIEKIYKIIEQIGYQHQNIS